LTPEDFKKLIELSIDFKKNPHKASKLLKNETVVMYFNKRSTRTRLSFSTAVARLGGTAIMTGAEDLQLGKSETIEDTANVVSRFAKAFVIRTYKDSDVETFAKTASIPVINALTDGHHPCQSVADMMTLKEFKGDLSKCKLAYLGDGNNVVHSLLEACALCGTDIAVATPKGYEPDEKIVQKAKEIAKKTGAVITVTNSLEEAVAGADALYGDVWLSMGDAEETRKKRFEDLKPYQITQKVMNKAKDGAIFMHCLPAHREEEVTAEVIDGESSVVFDQAENRMHTSMGVLYGLINGLFEGQK
jgi:ornithine carbamoyltransferase